MSILNCIPELWNVGIMTNLEKEHVFGKVCRCKIDAPITTLGQTVHLSGIGKILVLPYTGADITMTGLSDSGQTFKIDKADYFDFWVNNVDALQANVELMDEATKEASYEMKEAADEYIYAQLVAGAGLTAGVCAGTVTTISIISNIAECDLALKEALVPKKMRWLSIPFWAGTKLVLAGIVHAQDIKGNINGFITDVLGIDLYESANNGATQAIGGSYRAAAYAEQIINTEAFKPEKNFGDALKGLHIYGMKVIRPGEIVKSPAWTEAVETVI
ncbi:MAG: hypothetical protein MUP69_10200 [Candidatus Atribacteria bacterium]|nr:hypothetical protein [Candidatus Atribacteria bacterium]